MISKHKIVKDISMMVRLGIIDEKTWKRFIGMLNRCKSEESVQYMGEKILNTIYRYYGCRRENMELGVYKI